MVVTANKALLAKYGKQIFGEAERNGVAVFYEAAIAGGIPIVKVLKEGLAANEILVDIRNNQWNNKLHSFGNGQKGFGV